MSSVSRGAAPTPPARSYSPRAGWTTGTTSESPTTPSFPTLAGEGCSRIHAWYSSGIVRWVLIVFGGLPATGKTTLSRLVAQDLSATCLRIDMIEAAMWRSGIAPEQPTGLAAYVVANALADAQLSLGGTVVVDAVNPVEEARAAWRGLAARHGVRLRLCEVVCSDRDEHRRRVEKRESDLAGLKVPTWDDVIKREYEPWTEPRLIVDTVQSRAECLTAVFTYIGRR